ncbi:hypothetical protein NNO_0729 [Hydrogenimonas sp.]|nr:hypothetical protein NNO_0729 [Hydrogenimonas sp.]
MEQAIILGGKKIPLNRLMNTPKNLTKQNRLVSLEEVKKLESMYKVAFEKGAEKEFSKLDKKAKSGSN